MKCLEKGWRRCNRPNNPPLHLEFNREKESRSCVKKADLTLKIVD
jgi:hypothetical protein